jgi:acyl-CoA thioesterase-1
MMRTFFLALLMMMPLAAVAADEVTVLCLGDSLTDGYGVPRAEAWPALLEKELKSSALPQVKIINAGISGSTTASGPSRLKWYLKGGKKPAAMILQLGPNDGLRGLDLGSSRKNLREVIKIAKASGVKVLLAGMRIPPNYGAKYTEDFQRMYTELAKSEGVALIPFFLEGVAGERSLNQADGIHPNAAGHKVVVKVVRPHLEALLKS